MTDPLVQMANRDATEEMEGIHTHDNDAIKFELDSPSLIGRTNPERGPPQKIEVVAPLKLANQQLSLNVEAEAPLKLENGQLFIELALIGDFPNDIAAANGGVPIGGIYRNGSDLRIRTT